MRARSNGVMTAEDKTMTQSKLLVTALSLVSFLFLSATLSADQYDTRKKDGGIEIYMGVIPVELIQGRGSSEERHLELEP